MTKRSLFIFLALCLAGAAACRDKEQAAKNAPTASDGVAASQQDDSDLVQDIK